MKNNIHLDNIFLSIEYYFIKFLEYGGDKITKKTLFTMLIILNLALVCVNGTYATTEHPDLTTLSEAGQNLENTTNSTNITNSENYSNNSQNIQNLKDNSCQEDSTKQEIDKTTLNNSENMEIPQETQVDDNEVKNTNVNNATSNEETLTSSNDNKANIQQEPLAAGDITKTVNVNKFTINQIKDAAARVNSFIGKNRRLPNFIQISTVQVKMSDFLLLMTESVLRINQGITSSITLKDISAPKSSTGSFKKGNLRKAAYINVANRISTFINSKGIAPNYATTSLGKIPYESLIHMYSRVLVFHNTNKRLPNFVSVNPAMKIAPPIIPTPIPPANNPPAAEPPVIGPPAPEPKPDFTDVRSIWLKAEDIGTINVGELVDANITDIFIKANLISSPTYQTVLNNIITKLNNTGIRIHAWITCFKDINGKWVDPASTTQQNNLLNGITDIVKNYSIDGIHLDYVRYSGIGDNAAYKHNGTAVITSFVKDVYNAVKTIKPNVAVSAALMPEGAANGYYYGQDYKALAPYLDIIVPMIYKGNYGKDSAWIGSVTKYIVGQANGIPVIAGLQTYISDNNVNPIPASELNADIKAALDNGASGFALFRHGLIDPNFLNTASFSIDNIMDAASRVRSFIDNNNRLPNTVTIASKQVTMAEFLRLMTASVLQLNSNQNNPIPLKNVNNPAGFTNNFTNGNINQTEYMNIAQRIASFINSTSTAPGYANTSLGKIPYESLIYMYSRILSFHSTNSRLPNFVSMSSSGIYQPVPVPEELQKYLVATKNCQVNDPRIKALAASLTQNANTMYKKAENIFNWVRDNLSYSFYYNTKYGAVNAYLNKNGNCVDHSHLLIALARAAGIPARYEHATCTFTSGNTYGHVWAQLWIDGKWYDADATSFRNTLGVINNWNINTAIPKGRYIELRF